MTYYDTAIFCAMSLGYLFGYVVLGQSAVKLVVVEILRPWLPYNNTKQPGELPKNSSYTYEGSLLFFSVFM